MLQVARQKTVIIKRQRNYLRSVLQHGQGVGQSIAPLQPSYSATEPDSASLTCFQTHLQVCATAAVELVRPSRRLSNASWGGCSVQFPRFTVKGRDAPLRRTRSHQPLLSLFFLQCVLLAIPLFFFFFTSPSFQFPLLGPLVFSHRGLLFFLLVPLLPF